MTQNTQGPWAISNNATPDKEPTEWVIGSGGVGGGKVIATLTNAHDEAAANARLIAAAPDLLAALKELRDQYVDFNSIAYPEEKDQWPLLLAVEKAIEKATGELPRTGW